MLIEIATGAWCHKLPFWPNAVGLQYGLHGLGWSQRLSVISRIKGAEQWAASQKFAACKSESLTALTDSDCKLTALLQFTRDWIKLRFCIPSDGSKCSSFSYRFRFLYFHSTRLLVCAP